MGCCNSTPSASSPYEPPTAPRVRDASLPRDSSRAAINQSSRSLQHRQHASSTEVASSSRPNQRIRPPSPLSKSPKNVSNMPPPWTRSHLEREREAFFETRVTGRQEVWNALNVICQFLRRGELEEAQGIMDAANLSCPNGRVAKGRGRDRAKGGAYDERGALYEIPEWTVQDPRDTIEDEQTQVEKEVDVTEEEDEDVGEEEEEQDSKEEVSASKSKGKARAEDIGDEIHLRARLSDRGSDVEVVIGSKQTIRIAVQRIREQTGCTRVRLVYLGKPLDEAQTLAECGWRKGQVVNAFVFEGDEDVIKQKTKKSRSRTTE